MKNLQYIYAYFINTTATNRFILFISIYAFSIWRTNTYWNWWLANFPFPLSVRLIRSPKCDFDIFKLYRRVYLFHRKINLFWFSTCSPLIRFWRVGGKIIFLFCIFSHLWLTEEPLTIFVLFVSRQIQIFRSHFSIDWVHRITVKIQYHSDSTKKKK